MNQNQKELPLFEIAPDDPNVKFILDLLEDRDWTTAGEIIETVFRMTNIRWQDRMVRSLAEASEGHIAGGQRGYKLVKKMTAEEYHHWRNWMKSQADKMTARILKSDKVFYGRQSVQTGNGIL